MIRLLPTFHVLPTLHVLFALVLLLGGSAAAQTPPNPAAAPPATPAPTRAQAQTALDVLRDDAKRQQLITVLEAIARATPPVGQRGTQAAPAAATAPAAAAAPAAAPAAEGKALPLPLAPDSIGAQVLTGISDRMSRLSADIAANAVAIADFHTLGNWVMQLLTNPERQQQVIDIGWRMLVVLAIALFAEEATRRGLRRATAALVRAAPEGVGAQEPPPVEDNLAEAEAGQTEKLRRRPSILLLLRRLPYALAGALLDVLPALAMLAVGYAVAGTGVADSLTTRLVMIDVLHAMVTCQVAVSAMRLLVSPAAPKLRLVPVSDDGARYLLRWTRRLAVLVVASYAAAGIGLVFGLYYLAYDALLKLISMVLLVCLITIVLQTRAPVAQRMRAPEGAGGTIAVLRNRAAAVWHVVAIFYLVALWLVWAFEVPNGFSRLLRVVAATVVVAVVARLFAVAADGALDRALGLSPATTLHHPNLETRLRAYQPLARALLIGAIGIAAMLVLLETWGIDTLSWFSSGALGGRLIAAASAIGTTLLISLVVWEAINAGIQLHLARLDREAQAARSARLRTLLPMLRTTLLIAIFTVSGLMVLSEIGINIAPLLAGAGVIGLAIGIGSQKLVQDVITGLFLLFENTMQVGDVVSLGGLSGTVEALSIRSIRLRGLDGSVHTVPFSAVTTVTNQTRDYGYAVVDVSVGLNENPDRITELLREIARDMRSEPRWRHAVLDDIEIFGVEKFLDTALVLRTRIQTQPAQRWAVGREMNRRIKVRFDADAIESPWTSYRVLGTERPPLRAQYTVSGGE